MRGARLIAAFAALASVLTIALALPPAATAGLLAPEDATEAANALADAQEEQDVCYGWHVTNDFDYRPDVGSSTGGPGIPLELANCKRYVVLTGDVHWACSSCEDSDRALVTIESNLVPAPKARHLEDLGLHPDALVGDDDDVTLANMIGALPLIAAQTGAVPPVPAEVPPAAETASDTLTNKPGSDFMRESGTALFVFLVLLLSGPLLFFYRRSQTSPTSTPKET